MIGQTAASIGNYEQFTRHPRIDVYAKWARAVGLRLVVELDGAESDRVPILVPRDCAALCHSIAAAPPEDRALFIALAKRVFNDDDR